MKCASTNSVLWKGRLSLVVCLIFPTTETATAIIVTMTSSPMIPVTHQALPRYTPWESSWTTWMTTILPTIPATHQPLLPWLHPQFPPVVPFLLLPPSRLPLTLGSRSNAHLRSTISTNFKWWILSSARCWRQVAFSISKMSGNANLRKDLYSRTWEETKDFVYLINNQIGRQLESTHVAKSLPLHQLSDATASDEWKSKQQKTILSALICVQSNQFVKVVWYPWLKLSYLKITK